jgi:hypothetical protein
VIENAFDRLRPFKHINQKNAEKKYAINADDNKIAFLKKKLIIKVISDVIVSLLAIILNKN